MPGCKPQAQYCHTLSVAYLSQCLFINHTLIHVIVPFGTAANQLSFIMNFVIVMVTGMMSMYGLLVVVHQQGYQSYMLN